MKKKPQIKSARKRDEIRPEYDFDYHKAKPNRFAGTQNGPLVVLVDPEVAKVLKTPKSVNRALRAFIAEERKKRAS